MIKVSPITVSRHMKVPYYYKCDKCGFITSSEIDLITMGGTKYYVCPPCKTNHYTELARILSEFTVDELDKC